MHRRGRAVLITTATAVLLTGCGDGAGTSSPDLADAITIELPGFVPVAPRPEPATLCDPDPARADTTPPTLPQDLLEPRAAFYQQQISTVEIYAWSTPESEKALDEATAAAAACSFASTETQTVEEWTGSGWTGVRILHTVPGTELVDRRLVRDGDVVLLVVLRADSDDPAETAPADEALAAAADNLD